MPDAIRQTEVEQCFMDGLFWIRKEQNIKQSDLVVELRKRGRAISSPQKISTLETYRSRLNLTDALLFSQIVDVPIDKVIQTGIDYRKRIREAAKGRIA